MKRNISASIELMRKKMIESIKRNGLSDKETLALSQELDKLIIRYQISKH